MIKKTLVASVVIFLVILLGGFLLPAKYEAKRSLVINAPASTVFEYINNPSKSEAWSPWKAADPQSTVTYNEVPSGVGAGYSWTGEKSGQGSATIVESVPNEKVAMNLDFDKSGVATTVLTLEPVGDGVRTTWVMYGDSGMNPLGRYFGLMMDRLVGPVFEDGLTRLKKVAEATSP